MRYISGTAKKLLDYLWTEAEKNDGCIKIDNTVGFMYLSVELIGNNEISLAHYGEQNGDLMADPEMCFWKNENGDYVSIYYQNDYCGVYWESAKWNYETKSYEIKNETMNEDAVEFFQGEWAKNIIEQQNLVIPE